MEMYVIHTDDRRFLNESDTHRWPQTRPRSRRGNRHITFVTDRYMKAPKVST